MVFKKKLFSSSKKSGSSDSSNSPQSVGSNSPIESEKKKTKSNSKDETRRFLPGLASGFAALISGLKEKRRGSSKGKEASSEQVHSPSPRKPSLLSSGSQAKKPAPEAPILASSLGLNRIRTRSGPLPREGFFDFGNEKAISGSGSGNTKKESNVNTGQFKVSPSESESGTPEDSYRSPHYQDLLRMTSAPRKRFSGDIKSFSHELNSKGVRPFPLWKPRRSDSLEEILSLIRTKFDKAKGEVNSDLVLFAEQLAGILDTGAESLLEAQVAIEDLLILAKNCFRATSGEFLLQCEVIVQDLDDRRQELSPGVLKQLHTRMLFILTRCSRILQFHKESWGQEEEVIQLRESRADKRVSNGEVRDRKSPTAANALKVPPTKKAYSQEQRGLNWKEDFVDRPAALSSPYNETSKDSELPANMDGMSSRKPLPSPASNGVKEAAVSKEQNDSKVEPPPKVVTNRVAASDDIAVAKTPDRPPAESSHEQMSKHRHCVSEGSSILCRICEEDVPTTHVEYHSLICAAADKCDQKGVSVDERLVIVSVVLGKIKELVTQKDSQAAIESPDGMKISNASSGKSDVLSLRLSDYSRRGLEDMLNCFLEADNSAFMDYIRCLISMSSITRFGPKSDQGMTTSSADSMTPSSDDSMTPSSDDSMTPRSPIPTPRPNLFELLLGAKDTFHDLDIPHLCMQITELADIARCAANVIPDDDQSIQILLSCLENLKVVVDRRKFDGLIVETFGIRMEKLIQEKYLQLCELQDGEKVNLSSTVIDEDAPLEDGVVSSLRTSPVPPRGRISIDDFEEVKEISRGAFGRVFLARKRTTGDIFAIKVLKKADMIRKNAVESILTERDILINARNPFVVRFFYSFTSPENLYLVMEYVNGGDFYSMLGKLGCLDETIARVYIAEVVLALEYLHSLGVVHRDLKPDNLLIAHDGHVKLADFGLSKVGLINSTSNLSGPVFSGTSLLVEKKSILPTSEHQPERQDKWSAVGTPDYLAPEILLGTGHGATADWWSVGIILFEFIVGIPPFHGGDSEQIFDNILSCDIPWPSVPEDMSHEARDLIDRLLAKDPHRRLGARGAAEIKQHIFFKDINWHTLAEEKAAFVPNSEDALDTSYFQSRYPCNEKCFPTNKKENSSDSSRSGCLSNDHNQGVDERGGPAELETSASENNPFDNFSFKNLSQLAYINYDLMSKSQKDGAQPCLQRREETN